VWYGSGLTEDGPIPMETRGKVSFLSAAGAEQASLTVVDKTRFDKIGPPCGYTTPS